MDLAQILKVAVQAGASDVHLKGGLPPTYRVNGELMQPKDGQALEREQVEALATAAMPPAHRKRFETAPEVDFALDLPGIGRFRANAFRQRGSIGLAIRCIPPRVPTIKELLLPPVLEQMALEERGLILVTGTTSSGKSTTLAAMLEHVNTTRSEHVVTVEDPIEYVLTERKSIINQREVGQDASSFRDALRAALRQDPDIILVGEMRDHETIETALVAAETGHLVLSTLHTLDATETINRVLAVFPPHQQPQLRLQLAAVLRGIVSQRLLPRIDGLGRVPAVEVLRMTAHVRELVEDPARTRELPAAIAQGHDTVGMQTFDQSLMKLLTQGFITKEEATRQASNPADFALRLSGVVATSDRKWDAFDERAAPPRAPGESLS